MYSTFSLRLPGGKDIEVVVTGLPERALLVLYRDRKLERLNRLR
jgi:hypothetical protein